MKLRILLVTAVFLFVGVNTHILAQEEDFSALAETLLKTMRANHFHPAELDSDEYRQVEEAVTELGKTAKSVEEFLDGFNSHWRPGLFSHVSLQQEDILAARRKARGNAPVVREEPVTLTWQDDTAILKVNTMTGTIAKIDEAYDEIAAHGADKLIIDLRRNSGGAFGVLPLVGHLIAEPVDAGVFVNNQWYKNHDKPPGPADFASAVPCVCTNEGFLDDMLTRPMTSYRIEPMQPYFGGPVYVLTSAVSISAAEIAADALKATGRATIIGEKTLGILLQPQRFKLPGGFILRWPIGDYRSTKNGRIERVGVTPDIAVDADQALDVALKL